MKFKTIFVFFQAILGISFMLVFFLPLPILGWEWTLGYWAGNWFWGLVFILVMFGVFYYISRQTRYLSFIETENWSGLVEILEDDFQKTGKLNVTQVRLWIHSYFLLQKVSEVQKLEERLEKTQPGLIKRLGLLFALPYWLQKDSEKTEEKLSALIGGKNIDEYHWVLWALGFLKSSCGQSKESFALLEPLLKKKDSLGLLSIYLVSLTNPETIKALPYLSRFKKVPVHTWRSLWEKTKQEHLIAVFLDGIMEDALKYIKGEKNAI